MMSLLKPQLSRIHKELMQIISEHVIKYQLTIKSKKKVPHRREMATKISHMTLLFKRLEIVKNSILTQTRVFHRKMIKICQMYHNNKKVLKICDFFKI